MSNQIEINVPYLAEIGGKAIPTQGLIIKLPSNVAVRIENDTYGTTSVHINEELVLSSDAVEAPPVEEKPKCGYLSGVPLDVNIDIDTMEVVAPKLAGKVVT